MLRRLCALCALALAGLVALAPIAAADPATPGNYRSEVERITPATRAITAKVVGGDGFLDLRVAPGHRVDVPGYTGEPWLRIERDGTVQENQASSATYVNESRYGTADNTPIPAWVSIKRATDHPIWKTVGHGGHYVWHDHRIHYMTPQIAPTIIPGTNRVAIGIRDDGRWVVPLTVDGRSTEIIGQLLIYPAPSPLPQWALAGCCFVVLSAAGFVLHARATRVAAVALIIIGGLSLWAGASELAAVPALAGGNPIWVALPAFTILVACIALVLRSSAARALAVLASAVPLGVWAALRVPAFDKAIPLGTLNPTLTRLIAAGALGTAAGAVVAAIASGGLALRLPELDLDDDDEDSSGAVASAK